MRCAIVADIHANLSAFSAVLADMEHRGGVDKVWCLGDIVGYGPDPHECISLLRKTDHICVAGNHDWAAIGKIDTSDFNPDAAAASHWTAQHLTAEDRDYLSNLPLIIKEGDFTLVHGSPRDPIWEYILSSDIAQENFAHFETPYCLIGHSHVPAVFRSEDVTCTARQLLHNTELALGKERLLINPGGVGQPRDGNPRASYAIYDSESRLIKLYRVHYDIRATQDRMVEQGLPMRLVARLSYGV